jgi:ribosomal protein S7
MKKLLSLLVLAFSVTACSSVSPNAGEEAVLVYQPKYFGSGSCGPDIVKTGQMWLAPTTTGVIVSMFPRQQHFNFDDLFTSNGVPLDFQAAIQYQIVDSLKLVCQFGADDGPEGMGFFHRVLSNPFRTIVRSAVKNYTLNEMAITASAADAADKLITEQFAKVVLETGVPIKVLGVTLGRANPPDAIKTQRIATAEQEQRVNTEHQRKLAEDMRRAAEESRAIADRAYNDKMGMNTEQWLATKQMDAFREVCGGGKCTIVTEGVKGIINIK